MPGYLISFEGIEGSGKSTQIHYLETYLRSKGFETLVTREPGATVFGQKIRDILLDPQQDFSHPYTELLLFSADRLEHIEKVLKPALAAGKIVICDRYIDSTIAYQHGGRQLPLELVKQQLSFVDCIPDLTFLIDIDVDEGLRRAKKRASLDRFEQEERAFHQRVREGYLLQSHEDRVCLIEANQCSIEQLARIITDHVDSFLKGVSLC